MTSNFSLPKTEFWRYALKIYSKNAVKDICLYLQDNYAVNVNVLLYCIWYATSTRGKLDQNMLHLVHRGIREWHNKLVNPLRTLRKKLTREDDTINALRKEILSVEIEAEQVEQWLILHAHAGTIMPYKITRLKIEDCVFNLYQYFQFINVKLENPIHERLTQLLSEIFQRNFSSAEFCQVSLPILEN